MDFHGNLGLGHKFMPTILSWTFYLDEDRGEAELRVSRSSVLYDMRYFFQTSSVTLG